MAHDDAHKSHHHGFELSQPPPAVARSDARRWRPVAGVAVCLGLAGVVVGMIVARRQSESDAHLISDALQREQLRDGWQTLAAAAVQDAQSKSASATATSAQANPAAPVAVPPNVVIVNVPAPNAPPPSAAPTSPPSANGANGTAMGPTAVPTDRSVGYAPNQSLPPINFSPVPGYVPMSSSYAPTSASTAPQGSYFPVYGYGTGTSAPPLTPPVGNGSIPGSTPNPALPNNGLVGSAPVPGQSNGSQSGSPTPSAPVGTVPVSPGTPTLPSGFSAP